jgi:hypothetical protein
MSLLGEPSDWERLDHRQGIEPAVEHEVIRELRRAIGHGSLACPSCDLPLLPNGTVTISAAIECPFCAERAPARSFLRLGAIDTPRNAVYVRARLPS